jgi:mRNA-degrading endonuclease toxin of MazEF toxin-antitoxin module
MDIGQGDLYWINIPEDHTEGAEQRGRRPFVVVSRTGVNKRFKTVVVVPLTTFGDQTQELAVLAEQPPFRIVIPVQEMIKDVLCTSQLATSVAKTDQVRVVDKSRLEQKIGHLSKTATIGVCGGLAFLFDIR